MSPLLEQAKTHKFFLLKVYLVPLLGLSAITLVSILKGIPIHKFMRDPSAVAKVSPFIGVMSNLGVLLWCSSATMCLFSWVFLRNRTNDIVFLKFILYSGLMTILLMSDDLFLFHEKIYPYLFWGSEKIVYFFYGGLLLYGMMMFNKCILDTEYLILLIAVGFFGLSITIDAFQHHIEQVIGHWRILFEDGFKLLGIVGWFAYFSRCCLLKISRVSGERETFLTF
jgi:hypothetical protein